MASNKYHCHIHGDHDYKRGCPLCRRDAEIRTHAAAGTIYAQQQEEMRRQAAEKEAAAQKKAQNLAQKVIKTNRSDKWDIFCPKCERAVYSNENMPPCPNCSKPISLWVVELGNGSKGWRRLCTLNCSVEKDFGETIRCAKCGCKIRTNFFRWHAKDSSSGCSGCLLQMLSVFCGFTLFGILIFFFSCIHAAIFQVHSSSESYDIVQLLFLPYGGYRPS